MDNSLFALSGSDFLNGFVSFVDDRSIRYLAAFAVTYWLHSTLLLAAAWWWWRTLNPDSHFVRERVWKSAR